MRQIRQIVVPLLLPTAAYFLYLTAMRRRQGAAANAPPPDVPWTWLAIAGVVLLAVSLTAFALIGGAPPGSHYEPAQLIDGKIQPGRLN